MPSPARGDASTAAAPFSPQSRDQESSPIDSTYHCTSARHESWLDLSGEQRISTRAARGLLSTCWTPHAASGHQVLILRTSTCSSLVRQRHNSALSHAETASTMLDRSRLDDHDAHGAAVPVPQQPELPVSGANIQVGAAVKSTASACRPFDDHPPRSWLPSREKSLFSLHHTPSLTSAPSPFIGHPPVCRVASTTLCTPK